MFVFAADVICAATVVCRCQFEMILLFVAVGLGVAVLFCLYWLVVLRVTR